MLLEENRNCNCECACEVEERTVNCEARREMMNQIRCYDFAITELALYLDTHPGCKNGLALFKELTEKRLGLLADYAKQYNPLTQSSMITGTPETEEYGWAKGPVPWEGGHV